MDDITPKVEFQEEKSLPQMASNRAAGLYKFVISLGIAENEQQAQKILLGIAVLAFFIAFAAPFFITTGATYTKPTPQQMEESFRSIERMPKK